MEDGSRASQAAATEDDEHVEDEAADAADLVPPESKRLCREAPASIGGAAHPAASEPRLLAMVTERGAGDADGWAAAWATKEIRRELRRLQPFRCRSSEERADPRALKQKGTWADFLNKLERCVVAHSREELGVANVERSRRSSACDALETAQNTVFALKHKLQVRYLELIDDFCGLAEQLVENSRRCVAADVVKQRVLGSGFTSRDKQRKIVNAIETEMEKSFSSLETTKGLMREVGSRGLPSRSRASASSVGAAQPADSQQRLLPRAPTSPPPQYPDDEPGAYIRRLLSGEFPSA